MDQVVFDHKLESLRRCIKRVEEKTPSNVGQLSVGYLHIHEKCRRFQECCRAQL